MCVLMNVVNLFLVDPFNHTDFLMGMTKNFMLWYCSSLGLTFQINVAEGKRKARILASEAEKIEQINTAEGQAQALGIISQALEHKEG